MLELAGRGRRPGASAQPTRLALVLWVGDVGGAEMVTVELARQWRRLDVQPTVVIITDAGALGERLEAEQISYRSLGHRRGGRVLLRPFRFAREVAAAGPEGAVLADCSYLSALLRLAGYRGRIVGVEHGALLEFLGTRHPFRRRILHAIGARTRDVDVAVSDFMLEELCRHPHARRVCRIHNGVDTSQFTPAGLGHEPLVTACLTVGCACRLIPGKGVDQLIQAIALLSTRHSVRLRVAGDGPQRQRLEELAEELGVGHLVEFSGFVSDVPSFWAGCDLAVSASDTFIESFSMATLEAMACGKPVIGTRNGGIPEVLGDAGVIVPPADSAALADAIARYAADPGLTATDGARARVRVQEVFDGERLARDYLELLTGQQAAA